MPPLTKKNHSASKAEYWSIQAYRNLKGVGPIFAFQELGEKESGLKPFIPIF